MSSRWAAAVTTLPSLAKQDSSTFIDPVLLHFVQQVHDRLISKEPMYLLFNIAISDYWKVQDPCATKLVLGVHFEFGAKALVSLFCLASFCILAFQSVLRLSQVALQLLRSFPFHPRVPLTLGWLF